jgi:cullin-5
MAFNFKNITIQSKPESRCPELLANYCDALLRRNQNKKLTEEEIKEKLTNVVTLLKYVLNKDVFMKYHKAHLTRRLILDLSNDQEMEEQTVIMLKVNYLLKKVNFFSHKLIDF